MSFSNVRLRGKLMCVFIGLKFNINILVLMFGSNVE